MAGARCVQASKRAAALPAPLKYRQGSGQSSGTSSGHRLYSAHCHTGLFPARHYIEHRPCQCLGTVDMGVPTLCVGGLGFRLTFGLGLFASCAAVTLSRRVASIEWQSTFPLRARSSLVPGRVDRCFVAMDQRGVKCVVPSVPGSSVASCWDAEIFVIENVDAPMSPLCVRY